MDEKPRKRIIPAAQKANNEKKNANHELRMQAYHMRMQGYTYEQIGKALDRNPATIYRWVSNNMRKLEQDTLEQHRKTELVRLDKDQLLTDELVAKALIFAEKAGEGTEAKPANPELALKAATLALRAQSQRLAVSESRRRLLGLNAAERAQIETEEKTQQEKDLDARLKAAEVRMREQEQNLKSTLDEALADEDG